MAVWKNLNLELQSVSEFSLPLVGFKNTDDLIGLTDYDMKCEAVSLADHFRAQDQKVISEKTNVISLDIARYADGEVYIIYSIKSPLYDTNAQVRGSFGYSVMLEPEIINILNAHLCEENIFIPKSTPVNKIVQNSYQLTNQFGSKKLSPRQAECLFFLMRGKSIKTIASTLKLSTRTIEFYIDQLKCKYNCISRNQLIDLAITNGFLNVFPSSLLKSRLIEGKLSC